MSPTDHPRNDPSIAERNVDRLLSEAYQPEVPPPAFAAGLRSRVLDAAREAAATRAAATPAPASPPTPEPSHVPVARPGGPSRFSVGLLAAGLAAGFGLALLSWPVTTPRAGDGGRDRDVVWVGGRAYVPATSRTGADDPAPDTALVPAPTTADAGRGAASAPPPIDVAPAGATVPAASPPAPEPERAAVGTRIATAAGQRRRVALDDGSVLYVNEASEVAIDGHRRVTLHAGEVFVEVAPREAADGDSAMRESEATFVVATGSRRVLALGTRFGVRAEPDAGHARVLVTQGKVAVDGVDRAVPAGAQLRARLGGADPRSEHVEPAPRASHLLSWTRDLIAASRTPLVPASRFAGGALVALDPHGSEIRLELQRHDVDVHIEDGVARTTIDQTYWNHAWSRLEGTFYFPLPADASLSRLAMYVGTELMEGGMSERARARAVFETIRHQRRDPALLEWMDGSTFKMRVFPLEARSEKRIILSYTQRLDTLHGATSYRFPAGHSLGLVSDHAVRIRVKDGADRGWSSPSHPLRARRDGTDLVLEHEASNVIPNRDVVVTLHPEGGASTGAGLAEARFQSVTHDGHRYLALRWSPHLPAAEQVGARLRPRRHWVVMFEATGDRDPVLARAGADLVGSLLAAAEHDDVFSLVTVGSRQRALATTPLPATAENVAAAGAFLDGTHLIGALDLGLALTTTRTLIDASAKTAAASGADEVVLLHVGSAIPALGDRRRDALLDRLPEDARYVGVGVGQRWDAAFMREAAARTGGLVAHVNPDEDVAWRARELADAIDAPGVTGVSVQSDEIRLLSTSASVRSGEELFAVCRLDADAALPKSVTVEGRREGQPFAATFSVSDVDDDAGHLPRTWARLEIDRLLADDAAGNREAIVALSMASYVISPYTSLLVLENDAMYEQYGVDRGRKDHWARYPAPEHLEAEKPDDAGDGGDDAEPAAPPSVDEVLATIQVRLSAPLIVSTGRDWAWNGTAQQLLQAGVHASGWVDGVWGDSTIVVNGRLGLEDRGIDLRGLGSGLSLEAGIAGARLRTLLGDGRPTGQLGQSFESNTQGWFVVNGSTLVRANDRIDAELERTLVDLPGLRVQIIDEDLVWLDELGIQNSIDPRTGITYAWDVNDRWLNRGLVRSTVWGGDASAIQDFTRAIELGTTFGSGFADFELSSGGTGLFIRDGIVVDGTFQRLPRNINAASREDLAGFFFIPVDDRGRAHASYRMTLAQAFARFGQDVAYQRPRLTSTPDHFGDLLRFAPALATTQADIVATVEAEAAPAASSPAGEVAADAAALIAKARDHGWRRVVVGEGDDAFAVTFDGAGRFAWERRLRNGLLERAVCDGESVLHVYPELGLAARRTMSRHHRSILERIVPSALPPASELARLGDVVATDERTVVIVPRGAADEDEATDGREVEVARLRLTFADDGRLAERTLLRAPAGAAPTAGTVIARAVFAADGTTTWRDAEGEELARQTRPTEDADAPELAPSTDDLVVLPMPARTFQHVQGRIASGDLAKDSIEAADAELAALAGANGAWNIAERLADHEPKIFAQGDRRLGVHVLLAASQPATWGITPARRFDVNGKSVIVDPKGDHPASPVAAYLHAHLGSLHGAGFTLPAANGEGLAGALARTRGLLTVLATSPAGDARDSAVKQALQLAAELNDRIPALAWGLVIAAGDASSTPAGYRAAADAMASFEDVPGLRFASLTERARWLVSTGEENAASPIRDALREPWLEASTHGAIPPIDPVLRSALGAESFSKLFREVADRLAAAKRPDAIVRLSRAATLAGDPSLAAELDGRALAEATDAQRRPVLLRMLAYLLVDGGADARTDVVIGQLLEGEGADEPRLWRLAAATASRRGDEARAIGALERALDLEFERLAERDAARAKARAGLGGTAKADGADQAEGVVDLAALRAEYGRLLAHYRQVAIALATLDEPMPRSLLAKIIRSADRWRSLENDPTQACQAASAALTAAGEDELAWDYMTTPLSHRPGESKAWSDLAGLATARGDFDLADRCWGQAFELERSNAEILWQRAILLQQRGRRAEANDVLEQIADGDWQPRFDWIKNESRRRLGK